MFDDDFEITPKHIVIATILLLLLPGILLGSWYTIDQTERGVITRNGAVIDTAEPGLHFKAPFIDSVHPITLQTHKQPYKMASYSRDQQPAELTVSVVYHVNTGKVREVYSEYKTVDNLVERTLSPRIIQATKTVFGMYSASESIKDRSKLNTDVLNAIITQTTDLVTIESVQIENIDFSDAYEQSVEARMLAEVAVQKANQDWEREKIQANIVVTKAEAEARSVKLAGEAEAYAISKKGDALRDSPQLVELTAAQKWNGVLPTTMIPNAGVPMLDLSKR